MNKDFAKAYPVSSDPKVFKPGVKIYAVTAAAQTIDLSDVIEDVVAIQTSNVNATAITITGVQTGMKILLEYAGGVGVQNHVYTFPATFLINVAGNNVATANADGESLIIQAISSTRGIVIANNGAVALS